MAALAAAAVVWPLSTEHTHSTRATVGRPPGRRPRSAGTRPLPDPTGSVRLGVYAGPGNLGGAEQFATAVRLQVPYAFDYLSDSTWATISDPNWFLQQWAGTSFQVIWGVPMLPAQGATLAAGATGSYDSYFVNLAQELVAYGFGSSILMLGWQPDQPGSAWSVTTQTQAQQYVAYWDRIVAAMRSVPGAQFRFEWDIGDPPKMDPEVLYPGDANVNIVATNAFDVIGVTTQPGAGTSPGNGPLNGTSRWSLLASAPYGPDWFASFAAQHHKPLAIAIWGLIPPSGGGVGDDPGFVRGLLAWCAGHRVLLAVTWDAGPWSLTGGSFPRSTAVLTSAPPVGGAQS